MAELDREAIKEILGECLDLPAYERRAFLAQRCSPDAVLQAEISRLLDLEEQSGSFLSTPAIQLPQSETIPTGSVISNRYTVLSTIAQGGFSIVYKALDNQLAGRAVALKVLNRGIFTDAALNNEIQALARIDHPGVVGVLDAGTVEDGRLFLVTRLVEGETLRSILSRKGTLSEADAERLAHQLLDALRNSHALGVLHLDLKPENILISQRHTPEERVIIVDFGVAQFLRDTSQFRPIGVSPEYQAPEVRDGIRLPASDLYSLALVMRECLGERGASTRWRRFFAKALLEDPTARPQSADKFRALMPKKPVRLLTVVSLLGLVTLSILLWSVLHRHPITLPAPTPLTTLAGVESSPAFSPDGRKLFFSWRQGLGESDIYVLDVSKPDSLSQLTNHPANETVPVCSPDGKKLAFIRDQGKGITALIVIPSSGGAEEELGRGYYNTIDWTPDGRSIAVSLADSPETPHTLHLVDVSTRAWRVQTRQVQTSTSDLDPAYSPDGRHIAFVRHKNKENAELYVRPVSPSGDATGEPRQLTSAMLDIVTPSWTPDSKGIFFLGGGSTNRSLWFVPADGSEPAVPVLPGANRMSQIASSKSNRQLVLARSESDANIWRFDLDPSNSKVLSRRPILTSTLTDEEGRMSADGKLAFVSNRSGTPQVWLSDTDGLEVKQLTRFENVGDLVLFWSNGSKELLVAGTIGNGTQAHLIDTASAQSRQLPISENVVGWSHDARFIYTSPDGGKPETWKVDIVNNSRQLLTEARSTRVMETFDGRRLFFTKRQSNDVLELTSHGPRVVVSNVTRRAFAIGSSGIYYVTRGVTPALRYFRFSDRSNVELLKLDLRPSFGMDLTRDEKVLTLTLSDVRSDLLLLDRYSH